jgi:hypothetical protein
MGKIKECYRKIDGQIVHVVTHFGEKKLVDVVQNMQNKYNSSEQKSEMKGKLIEILSGIVGLNILLCGVILPFWKITDTLQSLLSY